jgi:feruloyl esterase
MAQSIAIERVDHIGVRVRNLDRALGFYRVLGFAMVRPAEGDDVAIIRNEHGVELNLVFNANAGDPAANILMDVRDKFPGYTHIALRVASIPETIAALNENDIPITQGPVGFGESGQISVFVRDPDRNVIELRGREQGLVEGVTRPGTEQGQCAARFGFAPPTTAPSCVASTLNVPNVTVTSATIVPGSTVTLPAGTFSVPEYCQVIGAVATVGECPTTGPWATGCETGGPGSAEFRLKLPPVWNNRFLFEGCGGNCGSVTSTSVNPVDAAEALGLGYAVVNTDTGHEQDPATILLTWAVSDSTPPVVNASAIIDFYYRAVHQVTVAAKQYVEAYYSGPIDHAYFDGCSTGGRQSMVEGTSYPVDYDGLIVGDPAIAAHTGGLSTLKQSLAFVPTGAYIPLSKVQAVDAAVFASCDALDGVTDGLIQNPAACNILPSDLAAQGILTTAQANALQAYILPETVTPGLPLFPGMPISDLSTANFITPGTNDEIATTPPFPTAAEPWGAATCPYATCGGLGPSAWSLGEVAIKAYVEENQFFDVNPNGPTPNWPQTVSATGNTVFPATVDLLYAQRGQADAEDPYKLMNFLNKGGKVVWYHGGSDSLITPFRSFWFYEQLASVMGGYDRAQDSVRLFIEPGMDHCKSARATRQY